MGTLAAFSPYFRVVVIFEFFSKDLLFLEKKMIFFTETKL